MRLKTLAITAGALGILAAGLAPLALDTTQAASSSKQNLAGTWVLDKSKTACLVTASLSVPVRIEPEILAEA